MEDEDAIVAGEAAARPDDEMVEDPPQGDVFAPDYAQISEVDICRKPEGV